MDEKDKITESDSKCYMVIADSNHPCQNNSCRHFLRSELDLNCSIIASQSGPKTLQEIGDYYGISRMRVCQIEKAILKKLQRGNGQISDFKPLAGQKTDGD
jgi:hypothetical protein